MTSQLIQKAVETLEKMKKKSSCGCPPFRSLHDGPCWTEEFGGESKAYNRALKDVQSLLPQIITGVIEETEDEIANKLGLILARNDWEHAVGKGVDEIVEFLASLKEVVKE